MRLFSLAAAMLCFSASACGAKGSGGQGIGFSPQTNQKGMERSQPLQLKLGRLYLPRDTTHGYVEIVNASDHTINASDHALQLQSHAGRIDVDFSGDWPSGEHRSVQAAALAPLHLHAQAGELVLLREGSAIETYATWGAHPSDWPTGYGTLASRLGVDTRVAYPLPLTLHQDLAIDLSQNIQQMPACQWASAAHSEAPIACEADPAHPAPALHLQIDGDGETVHLELKSDDPNELIDVFGFRLCTNMGCQTLMDDEPLKASHDSKTPQAMHMTLTDHGVAFGARTSTPHLAADEWVELVGPGDTPGAEETRSLGRRETRPQDDTPGLGNTSTSFSD